MLRGSGLSISSHKQLPKPPIRREAPQHSRSQPLAGIRGSAAVSAAARRCARSGIAVDAAVADALGGPSYATLWNKRRENVLPLKQQQL